MAKLYEHLFKVYLHMVNAEWKLVLYRLTPGAEGPPLSYPQIINPAYAMVVYMTGHSPG